MKCDSWCITLGSGGSIIKYKKEKLFKLNAFSNQILDTISAGDIFYAIASVFWFGTKSKKMTSKKSCEKRKSHAGHAGRVGVSP